MLQARAGDGPGNGGDDACADLLIGTDLHDRTEKIIARVKPGDDRPAPIADALDHICTPQPRSASTLKALAQPLIV